MGTEKPRLSVADFGESLHQVHYDTNVEPPLLTIQLSPSDHLAQLLADYGVRQVGELQPEALAALALSGLALVGAHRTMDDHEGQSTVQPRPSRVALRLERVTGEHMAAAAGRPLAGDVLLMATVDLPPEPSEPTGGAPQETTPA